MKKWTDLAWFQRGCAEDGGPAAADADVIEARLHKTVYQPKNPYRAMSLTPFDKVRVVIIGQDPYPNPAFATGLAFSVPKSIDRKDYPASLQNIYQELVDDLGIPYPKTGCLDSWAEQGVLLWNSVLTCEPYNPRAHRGMGWEKLTDQVLRAVDVCRSKCVFVLWGKDAQSHLPTILPSVECRRHYVITSSHPSPLSVNKGFKGSRPFSRINALLDKDPIDWRLS